MKLNEALKLGKMGRWQETQVRVSPGDRSQWFVMLQDTEKKSFILADNEDQPIVTRDINELVNVIRSIGLKEFTIFL